MYRTCALALWSSLEYWHCCEIYSIPNRLEGPLQLHYAYLQVFFTGFLIGGDALISFLVKKTYDFHVYIQCYNVYQYQKNNITAFKDIQKLHVYILK